MGKIQRPSKLREYGKAYCFRREKNLIKGRIHKYEDIISSEVRAVDNNQRIIKEKTSSMDGLYTKLVKNIEEIVLSNELPIRLDSSFNPIRLERFNGVINTCKTSKERVKIKLGDQCYSYTPHYKLQDSEKVYDATRTFAFEHSKLWHTKELENQRTSKLNTLLHKKKIIAENKYGDIRRNKEELRSLQNTINNEKKDYESNVSGSARKRFFNKHLEKYSRHALEEYKKIVGLDFEEKIAKIRQDNFPVDKLSKQYPLHYSKYDFAIIELDFERSRSFGSSKETLYKVIDMRADVEEEYKDKNMILPIEDFIIFDDRNTSRNERVKSLLQNINNV
ncbi:hypothetical protein [Vibrio mediterranei]|uniref:hypothetical protein n=1 Tax=Vibrio mediterranei TaxID=689 RepID=UPI00148D79F3|nr:hypothetical protein [Vibrio mediterranei]